MLKNQIYLARDITTENEVVAAIDNSHICAEAAFDDVCNKLIQLFLQWIILICSNVLLIFRI